MNYKSVIEEQIKRLQELQAAIMSDPSYTESTRKIAETILMLCMESIMWKR